MEPTAADNNTAVMAMNILDLAGRLTDLAFNRRHHDDVIFERTGRSINLHQEQLAALAELHRQVEGSRRELRLLQSTFFEMRASLSTLNCHLGLRGDAGPPTILLRHPQEVSLYVSYHSLCLIN